MQTWKIPRPIIKSMIGLWRQLEESFQELKVEITHIVPPSCAPISFISGFRMFVYHHTMNSQFIIHILRKVSKGATAKSIREEDQWQDRESNRLES
jgi:hypothetical protein